MKPWQTISWERDIYILYPSHVTINVINTIHTACIHTTGSYDLLNCVHCYKKTGQHPRVYFLYKKSSYEIRITVKNTGCCTIYQLNIRRPMKSMCSLSLKPISFQFKRVLGSRMTCGKDPHHSLICHQPAVLCLSVLKL